MGFIWMSYRGPPMLTGSLLEESPPKFSHKARFGNNWKLLIVLFLWTGTRYWSLFTALFFFKQSKQFLGKCTLPVTSVYCTIKNDYNRSSFANNIKCFCQKNPQLQLWTNKPPALKWHVSVLFKIWKSFFTIILPLLMPKYERKPENEWKHNYLNEILC